jgi:Uma2 family endonuclease
MPVQRSVARQTRPIPPLHNGDRLSQPEFHRRYEAMPPNIRAELIGGRVYMASPTCAPHGLHHSEFAAAAFLYSSETEGVEPATGATTILDDEVEPEPDVALRILPEYGGQCTMNEHLYWVGAPELVIEIAHSTIAVDLGEKKRDYERTGVVEYAVFAIVEQKLSWFDLKTAQELQPDRRGVYRSLVFPGLWIDGRAVAAKDKRKLLSVVRNGLKSPAHTAFVKRLKAAKRRLSRG